jgi:hypothetical protein
MGVIDKYLFEQRSHGGCGDSDYLLQRTSCCGGHSVEDIELSDLYFDAADLTKRVSLLRKQSDTEAFRCPLCGAVEWDLAEVRDLADVPEEWLWACNLK